MQNILTDLIMQNITIDSIVWAYRLIVNRELENLDVVKDKITRLETNEELVRELINSDEFISGQQKQPSNQKITIDSIVWAYRLILNREPENLDVIKDKIIGIETNEELVRDLFNSDEFITNQQELSGLVKSAQSLIFPRNESLIFLRDEAIEKADLERAAYYYQMQIENDTNVSEQVYLKLIHVQNKIKISQEKEAIETYKKWIEREYLIEHKSKIIYCPIAKNACTLLKHTLLEVSDEKENYHNSGLKMHRYIDENRSKFILQDFSYIYDPDYFKFIVLRNPFKRLVSTYGDKFVKRKHKQDIHSLPVIEEVYQHLEMEPNFTTSITFSQFIEYLSRTADCHLDSHWRPQSVYFAQELVKFDFVGQFENLNIVIKRIEEQLGLSIDANVSEHRINYGNLNIEDKFHDKYPDELNSLDVFPKSSQFYTPELEALVRERYAEDIAIYEQEFNVTLGRQY